jgi:hypothetical protein
MLTMDPTKKKMPDDSTGIQNDLPTDKCLMDRNVLQLTTLKTNAMDARGTSRIRTMAIPTVASRYYRIKAL